MSKSVEEQIREKFNDCWKVWTGFVIAPTLTVEKATQDTLSIIETEVIGEDTHRKDCPANGFTCVCPMWQQNENSLRQAQRNKLRSNPNE